MTQQIIDVGANANDGTGEPLRQAFTAVNDNFTQIWTAGPVGSQVQITGNIVSTNVTNLGLTLAGNGIGNITANSTIVPGTASVYDLGAPNNKFQYIYGDYLVGNGALITGIVANTSYNNANVAAFLPTYTGNLVSLTGPVRTTANVIAGNIITSGFLGVTGNISGGNITGTNLISSGYVSAAGNINSAGNVSGNYFIGNGALLTGIVATNIAAGALTGTTLSSNVLYSSLKVVDDLLYLDVIGNVTTQGQFIGSGAGLTNIPAANVLGQVANALVAGTVYTNAQPNITSVGTLTSLTATGNIAGNYFIGNGSLLTGLSASNVNANALVGDTLSSNVIYSSLKTVDDLLYLDVVGNVTTTGTFIGSGAGLTNVPSATTAGTVTNPAQPNITSVGTLTSVSVSGNATAGNLLTTGKISAVGNITGNYLIGNGSQVTDVIAKSVPGNALTGEVLSTNILYSSLKVVDDLLYLDVIGNVTGNYFTGNGRQLTGIIATSVGNLDNLVVIGNTTTGNLTTGGLISAVGNVSGNYFIGNGALLTGITVSAGTSIVNGNSNVAVNINGNVTVGVTGISNVSVFTPFGVEVNGLVSATGNIAGNYLLGNGALITGLPAGYSNADVANYLPTYTGNLISLTGPVTTTSNVTGGNVLTGGLISATGNVTGNYILGNGAYVTGVVSASGNVTGGNLVTAGNITGNYFIGNGSLLTGVTASGVNAAALTGNTLSSNVLYSSLTQVGVLSNVSVSGNIVGGNINTAGTATVSGNVTSGNVLTSGVVSATGAITSASNIIGGNITTAGAVSATGNVTGDNLLIVGQVSAAGNITGNYFIGNGSQLTGVTASSVNAAALTGNTLSSNVLNSSLTQVGNLANLSVVGNTVSGNLLTAGVVSATGNISGNYFIGNGSQLTGIDATGIQNGNSNVRVAANSNVTVGIGGTADVVVISNTGEYVTGVVSATGDVTGANLISAGLVSAVGNVAGNNIVATGLASITGNVIAGNVNTSNIQPVSGPLTISTASGNIELLPAGNLVLANTVINSVAYPLQDTDAATKLYVDNMVSTGLAYHAPVLVATTTTLATTTGGTITYSQPNGVANGVGATLTTTGSFNLIDTANVQTVGTRILVKNEANAVYNGAYTWANATAIVRSTDADQYGPNSDEALSLNDYFFVQSGDVNKGSAYVVSGPSGTITFGTSNIDFSQFSSSQTYTANTNAGLSLIGTQFNARVDQNTTAFDVSGNIIVKAGANLTTPNIGAATGTSLSLTGNVNSGNVNTGGLISATGNATLGNVLTVGLVSATGNISGNFFIGNGSQLTGVIAAGGLGNTIDLGTNTAGALISNAVTLTTTTTVTNGIALLNQVLGKLVPPSPPAFPNATTIALSGISTYRMANIVQVDNTPGANRAVAAGTAVANVLRVATYATNTIANTGPGDAGTIVAVRNGANVGNVTLNTNASPSANGTYGGNLVITNNFDYNSANANIAAGFWYVFSSRVSGTTAPSGWNELYIADTATANTNTTVWYYDNSSPSAPSFSSTTMTPPGAANLLYSSTIPHYTNNNNFTIAFNVANISGNTYPTSNTLASGSSGGAFAAPASINYNASNIGSNILSSFASASANTTASITTGFGGSSTGPSMSVNNSYSSGTLTLTTALGNTVLWKSGTATAIDESNVVINTTIGTGSGNAYRIINPGTGNTPVFTGSEAAFNSQSSTLQTYDATVVGSGSSGLLKHDQTNYSTGYLPAGPNLSVGRTGTQYFTIKFVRTAVSKFDVKYSGNIAGMWVALPGSVIDSSSSANGWINMAVAYGGAGYPGVNSPGNGSDGCAVGGIVSLNTSVTNNSKTCTFGTVSSSSTATNEIYVRIALTAGQSVTALTLETASN